MKRITFAINVMLLCFWGCSAQPNNNSLKLSASIPLPEVKGRIDHLSFDSRNQTVFVAALGNNTVEVIDLKNQKVIHSIKHLNEPQGVLYLA